MKRTKWQSHWQPCLPISRHGEFFWVYGLLITGEFVLGATIQHSVNGMHHTSFVIQQFFLKPPNRFCSSASSFYPGSFLHPCSSCNYKFLQAPQELVEQVINSCLHFRYIRRLYQRVFSCFHLHIYLCTTAPFDCRACDTLRARY